MTCFLFLDINYFEEVIGVSNLSFEADVKSQLVYRCSVFEHMDLNVQLCETCVFVPTLWRHLLFTHVSNYFSFDQATVCLPLHHLASLLFIL